MKNKRLSTNLSKSSDKNLSKWNEAIDEAKERIKTLRRSIRTFEELRDSGMPWPGTSPPFTSKSGRPKQTAEIKDNGSDQILTPSALSICSSSNVS